jgi:hypothetical protein
MRLNFGNTCHISVQNILFSELLPENVNTGIYKNKILPVVLIKRGEQTKCV